MKSPVIAAAVGAGFLFPAPRAIAAPPNDHFADASLITTSSGATDSVNTSTATVQPGEPSHAGVSGGHSIWYRLTPPTKDRFTLTTSGSGFDTLLAAYSGTAVNALTEIASNDDNSAGGFQSIIELTADPANPVSVAVDGFQGASGNAVLNWNPVPLTNDHFANARTISGNQGGLTGFNFRATAQAGEPNTGNSVWYRWTAPSAFSCTFRVQNPDFAAFAGIYTGSAIGALTGVVTASGAAGETVRATFNAVAGTTYRIQVKGATGGQGDFSLLWGITGNENSELLPDIISVASQSLSYMYGWSVDQNEPVMPGRTLIRVTTATANIGTGPLELRGSSANPAVYQRIFRGDGTFTQRFAGTFLFHPTHGHLHFDGWLQFHLRSVLPGNGVGDIVATGAKTSFAIMDLAVHDSSLPGTPGSALYGGGLTQGISVGWKDIYTLALDGQWIDVTNVPAGNYWLESVVDPDNRVLESDESNNTTRILITYSGTAPPNDAFSAAVPLTGLTAGTNGRNLMATRQASEPQHAGGPGASSVWYRWTAPSPGPAVISTEGSTFDTLLGVYTGSAVGSLTTVASNDNDAPLTSSRVTFTAVAGTEYKIAVDGKNGAAGIVQIAVNPAGNDQFESPLVLTGGTGTATGSTHRATAQTGEPAHAGSAAATSIWYRWTATMTGDAVINTAGSGYNAKLAVYTGSAVDALMPVASAVSNGFNSPASVVFHVVSGTTYRIAVDGGPGIVNLAWQAASAIVPYMVTHPPPATNAPQGADINFAAQAGGSPLLSYQWKFGDVALADGEKYAGTNSPVLTIRKLEFADSGNYTLTVTNPAGNVTSNPAALIVLTNPRTATIDDATGDIGGMAIVPVRLNASGNENALQFSLTFDPVLLGAPQVTPGPDAATAVLSLDRSMEATGKLGVSLTLPAGTTFPSGLRHVLGLSFEVLAASSPGATVLGFGDVPVVKNAFSAAGAVLPTVFDAGNLTLEAVAAAITSTPEAGGGTSFTVRGLRGKTYQLLESSNMGVWTVVDSAVVGPSGLVTFTEPAAVAPRAFYKAAPAP